MLDTCTFGILLIVNWTFNFVTFNIITAVQSLLTSHSRCAKSPDFALLITIWLNNRASFSIPSVFSSLGRRSHLPLTKGRSFIQVITIYLLNFCPPFSSPSLGGGWGEDNLLLPTAHSFKKISAPLNLPQYTPLTSRKKAGQVLSIGEFFKH